jgi:hypothetical protein
VHFKVLFQPVLVNQVSHRKATHFNTRSFNKQGSFFINKHGCLNLLMLKQIMAMKEFRPTHEIKHDIFYLACTGLVNQGKRLPSPMLAKKELHLVKCKQAIQACPLCINHCISKV